jgi:hypothetical protein
MEWWETFKEWFVSLGEKYQVNTFIFGSIYLGAIPFFFYLTLLDNKKYQKEKINRASCFINRLNFHISLFIPYNCW